MKSPYYVVIFHPYPQAAEFRRVVDVEPYRKLPNVLINPSLKFVQGHPTSHWKRQEDSVVVMTAAEILKRDEDLGGRPLETPKTIVVEKKIPVPVEKIVEKIKEVPVVQKEIVYKTPSWVYGVLGGLIAAIVKLIWG